MSIATANTDAKLFYLKTQCNKKTTKDYKCLSKTDNSSNIWKVIHSRTPLFITP